jgi:hypothetical protein
LDKTKSKRRVRQLQQKEKQQKKGGPGMVKARLQEEEMSSVSEPTSIWQNTTSHALKHPNTPNGTGTREETMDALESHYKETFTEKQDRPRLGDEWFNGIKTISDTSKELLEKPITKNDLTDLIFQEMSNGKSPGADGLTVKFYVKFWVHLVDDLHKSISHGLKKGKVSVSQRRSVIRLIAKKGKDQADIKGWRPISLLDTDTKILAKCLANKLKEVCEEVIGPEQLVYVNGRVLQDGHLLVGRVLELAREGRIKGLIATVDFKGAFDNIAHQAVWDSLHHMNCGEGLIAQIKKLYNGANSGVLNYGTQNNWSQLLKSARQGDPVAAYIFILLLKILLTRLRRHVKGLTLDIGTLLAVGYADDLMICVESNTELQKALCIIENF